MANKPIIESPDEAGVSGFAAIKRIGGKLASLEIEDSKFNEGEQIKGSLEDADIRELFPNAIGTPELKNDEFTFWLNYTKRKGEPPHQASPYMRVWVATCKKLFGKTPTEKIGDYVVIDQLAQSFKDKNGNKIEYRFWGFVEDEGAQSIEEYAKQELVGKNASAAIRALLTNNRLKNYPELSAMHQDGTLAEKLGLKVDDDGVYQLAE